MPNMILKNKSCGKTASSAGVNDSLKLHSIHLCNKIALISAHEMRACDAIIQAARICIRD